MPGSRFCKAFSVSSSRRTLAHVLWGLLICVLLLSRSAAHAQAPNIYYVYDDLGRLAAVVDQQGNMGSYAYDAVGNITGIQRVNVADLPGNVGISLFAPKAGRVGAVVEIFGKGFSATLTDNTVTFNGTPATVLTAATNRLTAAVPAGATTGPIAVTSPLGTGTSSTSFIVVGVLAVSPATATLNLNGTQTFSATEGGVPTTNVTWAVNGITGGDATVGTISTAGVYAAPATIPATSFVTVRATHGDDRTTSASATVAVLGVPRTIKQNLQSVVSVQVTDDAAFVGAQLVSVALQPAITAVSPATGARGVVNLPITLTGSGFTGATALTFLLNDTADGTITVSNLMVSGDGTQATALVSIASGSTVGARVVQITMPGGASTRQGTGGNLFTVQ